MRSISMRGLASDVYEVDPGLGALVRYSLPGGRGPSRSRMMAGKR